ncbi:FG-GAP-like repeat-containing protein, partial [Flavobacterium sp. LS1R49]
MISTSTYSFTRMSFLFCLIILLSAFETITAQSPTISSFSPTSGAVGSTVTISGANFGATIAENIVFFGATKATITAASTASLTVTVPVGATFEPMSVLNSTTTLVGYSTTPFITTFTPNKARITIDDIQPKVNFPTGNNSAPFNVIIIDLDGDGKPDLVTINSSGTSSISIFRNISTSGSINAGSFAPSIDIIVGSTPRAAAAGDFDGDGKPDLAITNSGGASVTILKNTSSGIGNIAFVSQTTLTSGLGSFGIVAGDIDGDGKTDLAVADNGTNLVSVFQNLSSGIGNFSFAAKNDFIINSAPYGLSIGDIDSDGKMDLITPNNNASGTVSVLRNTSTSGTINFDNVVSFPVGASPFFSAIGDLNKDGKPDIVVANGGGTTISILKNTSSGAGNISFDPKVDVTAINIVTAVGIADIDGDGNLDVVAASHNSILSFFHNTSTSGGTITLGTRTDFANDTNCRGLAIGDLDGDGKNDVVTANNASLNISIFRNNPLFAPTVQATNVVFTTTTATTTTATWTIGNGSSRAVFMYAGITGSPLPIDLTVYTANASFGTGTQIGTSGWYCVYNGTGTTINITGLTAATNYRAMVIERNGSAGDEMYLSTVGTDNPANVTTLSNIATLSNLTISQGILAPVFATGTTSYSVTLPNATTSLTVTPTTTDPNATVKVNGVTVTSGSPSGAIALAVGSTTVTTVVTAQDGITLGTYIITVTRVALPIVVISNPAAVCSPATVDITAVAVTTGSDTGLTYTYFTDALGTTLLSTPTAVTASGTYYIKGTNTNGCSTIVPVTVIINALPIITITNPAAVCSPNTVDITATAVTTGSDTGLTYTYFTDALAATPLATPSAITTSGTYYIKGTNTNGCSTIVPVTVIINALPIITITNPAAVCSPNTVDITAGAVTTGSDT